MNKENFDYAIENTRVIVAPERKIATFGSTSFRFYLVSELLDRVNEVRVRDGRIHADRPQILTPDNFARLLLEGFGEKAEQYIDQLRERGRDFAVLRYGFQFRKTDVVERRFRDRNGCRRRASRGSNCGGPCGSRIGSRVSAGRKGG